MLLINRFASEKQHLNNVLKWDFSYSARKSESISSLNSDFDDIELMKLRQDRERLEDELSEKKTELEDAKASGVII